MTCLPRSFYGRPTSIVARDLIGHVLVRVIEIDGNLLSLYGTIAETEAYGYRDDEASHAFRGRTTRNSVMFGEVGRAYVYLSYGIHFCLNVSARALDCEAGAVLLRAVMPAKSSNLITPSGKKGNSCILSGPGRLTKCFRVSLADNGTDLTSNHSRLRIERAKAPVRKIAVVPTKRIGISKNVDMEWRFTYSPESKGSALAPLRSTVSARERSQAF